ncbi:MAG: AmmeMemoRadiSam system protein A [Candidatus Atribacteria bacterium]|nr:MAG: AmmeMemoRadiSam system protein A [Candidatus Atribacteria bacterium]
MSGFHCFAVDCAITSLYRLCMKRNNSPSPTAYAWRRVGLYAAMGAALVAVVVLGTWLLLPRSEAGGELSTSDAAALLTLARAQLIASLSGDDLIDLDPSALPARIRTNGAAFVSLVVDGALRGCMIDQFEPHEPLYLNVLRNTEFAALADERFVRIQSSEMEGVRIEISVVYEIQSVAFDSPDELLDKLARAIAGVILRIDDEIATYLPSVWETFPDPTEFLTQLCIKAGWESGRWRIKPYPLVQTYRVSEFAESASPSPIVEQDDN